MRDAPFSLKDSVTFTNTDPYGWANVPAPQWKSRMPDGRR